VGNMMQHDERKCNVDAVLVERTSNNIDVVGGISGIDAIRDQSDRG